MQPHSFNRIIIVLTLALLGIALSLTAIEAGTSILDLQTAEQLNDAFTPTHLVYMPFVSSEYLCTDPPSGNVIITGRATVHGRPAQPGVPFVLSYRPNWEWPPTIPIETVTTWIDGSFCFKPIAPLQYCHGMWYQVTFNYVSGTMPEDDYAPTFFRYVFACEAGKVYTVNAEIGK